MTAKNKYGNIKAGVNASAEGQASAGCNGKGCKVEATAAVDASVSAKANLKGGHKLSYKAGANA